MRRTKGKAFKCVASQRFGIQSRPVTGLERDAAVPKHERIAEQGAVRFEKAIHFTSVAYMRAGHTGFHPAANLTGHSISQHRLHTAFADDMERGYQAVETAELHKLELDETRCFQICRAANIINTVDRFVEHHGHARHARDGTRGFPIMRAAR